MRLRLIGLSYLFFAATGCASTREEIYGSLPPLSVVWDDPLAPHTMHVKGEVRRGSSAVVIAGEDPHVAVVSLPDPPATPAEAGLSHSNTSFCIIGCGNDVPFLVNLREPEVGGRRTARVRDRRSWVLRGYLDFFVECRPAPFEPTAP